MLSYQSVVIDFEGFRISNQPFVIKELSVRAFDFHDTILLKPPYTSSVLPCKTQKVYAWLTKNLHGLTWESGIHEYSFFCSAISSVSKDASLTLLCTLKVLKSVLTSVVSFYT